MCLQEWFHPRYNTNVRFFENNKYTWKFGEVKKKIEKTLSRSFGRIW